MRIQIENLGKVYKEHNVLALSGLNLSLENSEFVALMGPSGCGKSSLLNIIAGIDRPSSGKIYLNDQDLSSLSESELSALRREKVGFVFQFFNLLSTLNVIENVALTLELSHKYKTPELKKRANEMLAKVGLSARADFFPSQLSGGEMQRVAIARALVHEPELIVADEPTGNLDSENGREILKLFSKLCKEGKHTAIMATHSEEAATYADRVIRMQDGRLVEAGCI